ncbi:hypothetical protein QVD17_38676 [Tagetes erecta]|uniref:Uncharacterized protein n=1 Tax=Tagetes erecta TaxID=13708 RepID=A0AAD8JSJ7_TARER|nr:hypothetical protein QVD17_38676 [Tagetes erecta]
MCGGGDHGRCMYQTAFKTVNMQNEVKTSPTTVGGGGRRFSGEVKREKKDEKRIRELEKTQNVLHLILWGPK